MMDRLDTPDKLLFIRFAQKQLNNAFEIPTGYNEIEWLRELKNRIDSCDDEKVKSLYLFHALYDFELNSQISKFGIQKFKEYRNQSSQSLKSPNSFQHYAALFFEAFIPAFLLDCIDILKLPKYYKHLTRFCLVTNELFESSIVRLTDVKYHEMMLVMMIRFNIEIEQALEDGSFSLAKLPSAAYLSTSSASSSQKESNIPYHCFNTKEVTTFYSCLHAQYKLVATILQCFIKLPNCEMTDTFKSIAYVENVILKLDNHHVPLGCIVEGSIILSRIVYMDCLRAKSPQELFDNLKRMLEKLQRSRLYIPILAAFINDLPFYMTKCHYSPAELTKLNTLILDYGDSWDNKSDSKYLYLLGNLYTVWSNFILKLLAGELMNVVENDDVDDFNVSTHKVLDEMLRFTFMHFASWSVPQVYETFKGAMQIHLKIFSKDNPGDFVENVRLKCDNFLKLGNPQVIYRVFLTMYEIMDTVPFVMCFGQVILMQSISTYLESFILGSDACHLDFELNFHDEFDESDRLDETLNNLYQATNRNNDLVAVLNLRYKLFGTESEDKFCDELEEFLLQSDSFSELARKFFFNKIIPKLIFLFKKEKGGPCRDVPADIVQPSSSKVSPAKDGEKTGSPTKVVDKNHPGAMMGRMFKRIVHKYLPEKPRAISVRTLMSILKTAPKFEQFGVVIFDGSISECNRRIQNVALNHFDIDIKLDILDMFLNDYPMALKTFQGFWKIMGGITVGIESLPELERYLALLSKFINIIAQPKTAQKNVDLNGNLNFDNVENFFKFICELPKEDEDSIPILMHLKTIRIFLPYLEKGEEFEQMTQCLEMLKKCLLDIEGYLKHSHDEVRDLSKNILLHAIKNDWVKRKEVHRQRKKWETNSWDGLSVIHPSQANHSCIQMRLFIETQRPFENREEAFLELLNSKLIPECDRRVKLIQKKETNTLEHPTFAVMTLIRTIVLEDLKVPDLGEKLVTRLIGLALAAGKAVLPVVTDDSPEGHLPPEEKDSGKSDDELYLASQRYLLNSWMTIRESVLIMVGLMEKYPSPTENIKKNISCNQAQEMLNYMFHNQLNLVHRGAFELSSNAMHRFIQIFDRKHSNCQFCDDKLMNLTENVFTRLIKNSMLEDIKENENKRKGKGGKGHKGDKGQEGKGHKGGKSQEEKTEEDRIENITRRSAGFPGFIQAIFAVLPEIGANMMSNLLTLIESETVPKAHWQVVHTFNIFRQLIQDSKLNDHLSKMMERVLVVCLKWFNYDPAWICTEDKYAFPIRNACSMLFSTLMTKIFGVKRNKQDTSPKNRMFSQLFFQTYPSVFGLLLETLGSVEPNFGNSSKLFLHPSLYILSRITPSKVSSSSFEMSDFLEPLRKIVDTVNDFPVRKLAAQIYAQLLAPDFYKVLWSTLNTTSPKHPNCYPSLLLINEILPTYARDCQQRTVRDSLVKERQKLLENMFAQAIDLWKGLWNTVPFGIEGLFFQMLFHLFTIGNLPNSTTLNSNWNQELEAMYSLSVLNAKRKVNSHLKWYAIEKSTVQAAQFFFTVNIFQGWQFLDVIVKINNITDEFADDCRLFVLTALKEVFFISINSTKKIQRIEREKDESVFDNEIQELVDYIRRAFDSDMVPSQFFKMVFSAQFLKSIVKNLLEFIFLISGQHDYLLKRQIRGEILNELFELIFIRLQAISVEEMLNKKSSISDKKASTSKSSDGKEAKEVKEPKESSGVHGNLTTVFDIGLSPENVKTLLKFVKEDRPIVKQIRYSLLSVICLAQKSWTMNRDKETFMETINTLGQCMASDDSYLRLSVMRCAFNLFYEVFESPYHPWREGRGSVFMILFRLFKILLNAACDKEREIAREAGVYIRKMFMETRDAVVQEQQEESYQAMFPYTQDGTLTMGSTIIQCLLGEYFKFISSVSDNGKATEYPGIDKEISSQFTFNEIIFFEFLIASVNSLDMIYEIAQSNLWLLSRHVFTIRQNSIQNSSIQFIGQPIHRNEIKRRYSKLMTKEEEEMVERVLKTFESTHHQNGLGESFPYLRPTP